MLPAFACSELYPWLIVVLSLMGARLVSSATRRTRKIGFSVWMISNGMIGFGFYQTGDIPQGPGVGLQERLRTGPERVLRRSGPVYGRDGSCPIWMHL